MERLNVPLDVGFINRNFFPNDLDDLHYINEGRCFLWAYIAFQLYQGVQLWDFGTHAFVRYRGKFYDSERPLGEPDWRDLPATNFGKGCGCDRCKKPAARLTVNQFKDNKNWGKNAKNRNIKWADVRAQVQQVVERRLRHET